MEQDTVAARFTVTGKVQGVFFRASAAREAARLGLRGHAINLPDGSVEVLAAGSRHAVEQMREWLDRGPPAAKVTAVSRVDVPPASLGLLDGFHTA